MWMIIEQPLDLDSFYESRQQLAGENGTMYAQRQLAGIRQVVAEAKLNSVAKAEVNLQNVAKAEATENKEEKKGDK